MSADLAVYQRPTRYHLLQEVVQTPYMLYPYHKINDFFGEVTNPLVLNFFGKCLYAFLLIKILLLIPLFPELVKYQSMQMGIQGISPKNLLIYFYLIPEVKTYTGLFQGISILVILLSLILKPNRWIALVIFWIGYNYFRAIHAVANGSDMILNLLLFLNIFLTNYPLAKWKIVADIQILIGNWALLIGRLHISFIYLLSGYDKITDPLWRNGEAIFSIFNLPNYIVPNFQGLFNEFYLVYSILSWITIFFEMSAAFLLWWKPTKVSIIMIGIIFHLFIAFGLSLPDFGFIMIVAYIIFLNDADLSLFDQRLGSILEYLKKLVAERKWLNNFIKY